jgi:hypothetical protein
MLQIETQKDCHNQGYCTRILQSQMIPNKSLSYLPVLQVFTVQEVATPLTLAVMWVH